MQPSYSMSQFRLREQIRTRLGDVFQEAVKQRGNLTRMVPDPAETRLPLMQVPEWVLHERNAMYAAINKERKLFKKAPIAIETFVRVENCAKGHCDYASKLSLYATELVFDDFRGP